MVRLGKANTITSFVFVTDQCFNMWIKKTLVILSAAGAGGRLATLILPENI